MLPSPLPHNSGFLILLYLLLNLDVESEEDQICGSEQGWKGLRIDKIHTTATPEESLLTGLKMKIDTQTIIQHNIIIYIIKNISSKVAITQG